MDLDQKFDIAKYTYAGVRIVHLVFHFCYFVYTVYELCEKGENGDLGFFIVTLIFFLSLYTSCLLIIIKFKHGFVGVYMEGIIFGMFLILYTILTIFKVSNISFSGNHENASRLLDMNKDSTYTNGSNSNSGESPYKNFRGENAKIKDDIIMHIMKHYSEIEMDFRECNLTKGHFGSKILRKTFKELEKKNVYWYYIFPSFYSVLLQLSVLVASFYHRHILLKCREAELQMKQKQNDGAVNNQPNEVVNLVSGSV
ncbi:UNVERIFIED_CONTAM: hypothetical protein RMT77_007557 [Armadillidium vulgare]